MGAGYVSKDSWSRCETPSMLYDTVRNPNTPPIKSVPSVSSKDTIETTEQRLKREMIDRFQAKGLELPHETYVAVVQVGKYVFLAVMLPVYLGLYGIPHWFLVTALPQVFGLAGKLSRYCSRFTLALAKRIKDLMKEMMEQLIGDALRLSRDRAKNFWKRLTAPWIAAANLVARASQAISASFNKIKENLVQALQQFHAQVNHNVQATNRWVIHHALYVADICWRRIKSVADWTDRYVLTPLISFCLPPFRLAARAGRFAKTQLQRWNQACRRQVKSLTDPIVESITRGRLAVKRTIKVVIEPVASWVREKKQIVNSRLEKIKIAIAEPVSLAMAWIKNRIPDALIAGWNMTMPIFAGIPSAAKRIGRFAWKMTPQKFKNNMDKKRQGAVALGRGFRNVARGTVSGLMWIVRGVRFAIRLLFKWAAQCFYAIQKGMRKLVAWLAILPRKIKKGLIAVFKLLALILSYISFALHVVVLLVWLASLNGFYLMRRVLYS